MADATISATMASAVAITATPSATGVFMDLETFKANLRGLLKSKGMSQIELAKKSGVGEQWVRRVCSRGLTRLETRNQAQLEAICKVLGVSAVEQLWNPNFHVGWDRAAWYGGKVEEILRATQPLDDFSVFDGVTEESIIELANMIDRLHKAIKKRQPRASRLSNQNHNTDVVEKGVLRAIEYSLKLKQLLLVVRPEEDSMLRRSVDIIDARYNARAAERVLALLKDSDATRFADWLAYFEDRRLFEYAVGVALGVLDEQQILDLLSSVDVPESSTGLNFAKCEQFRDMCVQAVQGDDRLSTSGGDVGRQI